MEGLREISSNLLFLALIIYLVSTVFFAGAIKDKRGSDKKSKMGIIGLFLSIIGFLSQLGYFITRWIVSGHAPVSNLFEYTTFFGMCLVFAFIIFYLIYRINIIGVFTMPIAMLVIVYASMFPKEISPLVPSLKSYWLYIHVTTAALGEALLAVSFATGLIYLIKKVDQTKASKKTFWLEFILYGLISTLGFIIVTVIFANIIGYESTFKYVNNKGAEAQIVYQMPSLVGPNEGEIVKGDKFDPLFEVPPSVNGKKLNTVIYSLVSGLILYVMLRLIFRKRIAAAIQPLVKNVNLNLMDEISYRAITIGFPVFTLGALIFAAIWAQEAWNRFWGWDPKEVWALVTWFFYAAFLHLRLSRGWHGEKSAWLATAGFAIIMFNLVAVNLIIKGLHSYA